MYQHIVRDDELNTVIMHEWLLLLLHFINDNFEP